MQRFFYLMLLILFGAGVKAQISEAKIKDILNKVNLDSLKATVRILSGEDSVKTGSKKSLITIRQPGLESHQVAGDFILQTLKRYNLSTFEQFFTTPVNGRNIYGVQPGKDTSTLYIICAHYDAVRQYAADDNSTGVAAVLEAARVMAGLTPDHSIAFCLWDQEEHGLYGSAYYAGQSTLKNQRIGGVINLDMLGWDNNNDNKAEIHVRNYAQSFALANRLFNLNNAFMVGLIPSIINPGTTASDHASFWNQNFTSVLLIECVAGGDLTPYIHTILDRASTLNFPYFQKMTKLAVGGIATISSDLKTNAPDPVINLSAADLLQNFPNPFNLKTRIEFLVPERSFTELKIYSLSGNEVKILVAANLDKGKYQVEWIPESLSPGIYLYRLNTGNQSITRKMTLLN